MAQTPLYAIPPDRLRTGIEAFGRQAGRDLLERLSISRALFNFLAPWLDVVLTVAGHNNCGLWSVLVGRWNGGEGSESGERRLRS